MVFSWLSSTFPMVFLRFSDGFSMVFLWLSDGFPMVFECFLWQPTPPPPHQGGGTQPPPHLYITGRRGAPNPTTTTPQGGGTPNPTANTQHGVDPCEGVGGGGPMPLRGAGNYGGSNPGASIDICVHMKFLKLVAGEPSCSTSKQPTLPITAATICQGLDPETSAVICNTLPKKRTTEGM